MQTQNIGTRFQNIEPALIPTLRLPDQIASTSVELIRPLRAFPSPDLSKNSPVQHFKITFFNRNQEVLGQHTHSIDCASGISSDVLPYFCCGSRVLVGVREKQMPAIAFREHLPVIQTGDVGGTLRVCSRVPGPTSQALGGAYFPSAGSSTEMCNLASLRIRNAFNFEQTGWVFVELQQIISDYLSGKPSSTCLVLAALRLAAYLGYEITTGLTLDEATKGRGGQSGMIPMKFADQLRAELKLPPKNPESAYTIHCEKTQAPDRPFLNQYGLSVSSDPAGDNSAGSFEAVVRRGIDSVDVAAYTWQDDKLCLVMKRGLRPALAARILVTGASPDPTSALAYEGIAESLEGEESIEQVGLRAAQGVREEAGIEPIGIPRYLGSSFPSPKLHSENAFNFMVEVDPEIEAKADFTVDERVDVACVPVNDIIELCNEGVIRDPRLEINARLLAMSLSKEPSTS